jgi:hypothetical protein
MGWKFTSTAPVFMQIIDRVQTDIISGKLRPGDKLISVRELAQQAGVNPNTMQRALLQLEQAGLIYTKRGSGRFITEDEQKLLDVKAEVITSRIKEFVLSLSELGLENNQIIQLLNKYLKGGNN